MIKNALLNVIYLGFINVSNLILPIILIPILSDRIGLELLSDYMVLTTILMFGFLVSDYSFNITATRDVIKLHELDGDVSEFFSLVQSSKLIISTFYSIIAIPVVIYFLNLSFFAVLIFLISGLISNLYLALWYRQALQDLKLVTLLIAFSKLSYFFLVFFFVKSRLDFEFLIMIYSIPQLLCALSLYHFTLKKQNLKVKYILNATKIFLFLRKGINVFVGDFSPNLYNNLPSIFLGLTSGGIAYAAYSVSQRLSNVVISFQFVISRGLFPFAVKHPGKALNLNIFLNSILLFPILLVVFVYTKEILIFFLGETSDESLLYLRLLSCSAVFTAFYNIVVQTILLPKGMDREFRIISMYVSIISALIGIFLIYNYSILGVVLTLFIARLLLCLTSISVYFKNRI